MSAARIMVLVPVATDAQGVANRSGQQRLMRSRPDVTYEYRAVKAGPTLFDGYHDSMLADISLFEAGLDAQREGFDAVCVDTISDSGVNALRTVLDIPVIGPGRASYLLALLLGRRFSVVTQWEAWRPVYEKGLREYGLEDKCASVRAIDVPPDLRNLIGAKAHEVLPKLEAAARACVEEDGADVILLGSTTMHEAQGHLAARVGVPILSPGPVSYKLAEALLDLGLTHSRVPYPAPLAPQPDMIHAMLDAAARVTAERDHDDS
jgi:allantoin racemase